MISISVLSLFGLIAGEKSFVKIKRMEFKKDVDLDNQRFLAAPCLPKKRVE
jgi:hypothetical protein